MLNPGTRLNEAAIALAASVGKSRLPVFVRPHVAVLTTGDEIVDVDVMRKIGPTQIRNSNSYSLAAQIQAGGETGSAADRPRRTTAAARINRARLAGRSASDDRRRFDGPLRSGRASTRPNGRRVFFHGSKNSAWSSRRVRSRPMWRGAFAREGASARLDTNTSSAFPAIRSQRWSLSNCLPARCSKRWPDCLRVRFYSCILV